MQRDIRTDTVSVLVDRSLPGVLRYVCKGNHWVGGGGTGKLRKRCNATEYRLDMSPELVTGLAITVQCHESP